MHRMNAQQLDEFVTVIDQEYAGNLNAPGVADRFYPIEFVPETKVDQDLDPFSPEYLDQQLALYHEIAGRDLNQWDGELHPVDVASLVNAPNPLGLAWPSFIGEHVRAISTMLGIADLAPGVRVLDLGAGHGLSSEVLAFSGCTVHAIDIDPALCELSRLRAAARGLPIERSILSYDDISSIEVGAYDAAFFFQSFHHCLKPWELISSLRTKLKPGGVIAFTGEPIQSTVWRNWGLRQDQESLYVARKYGWFESGWSHEFLRACFERNGYTLHFFSGGHGGGEIGIAAVDPAKIAQCTAKALGMELAERFKATATTVPDVEVKPAEVDLVFDTTILRSPAGFDLRREGEGFVCEGTGCRYSIVDGNAHIYDLNDVPASLVKEVASFGEYVATSLVPDLNIPAERIYADAKAVNTEFMFSSLDYDTPASRRIVELGAWRCESIKRFADLGFESYALDFFPGMVDAAFREHGGTPFRRISAPMSVLPFKDRTIDLLCMHATLHHAVPRREEEFEWYNPHNMHDALCEVRRVLKPDGAFFLMGEGVYPEGLPISERYHEKRAQAGETFYESHYTMSEYEQAFAKAEIFPTLMSNQTAFELELHTYHHGKRVDLIKIGDLVYLHDCQRLFQMSVWNAGPDWGGKYLPAWIKLRNA